MDCMTPPSPHPAVLQAAEVLSQLQDIHKLPLPYISDGMQAGKDVKTSLSVTSGTVAGPAVQLSTCTGSISHEDNTHKEVTLPAAQSE